MLMRWPEPEPEPKPGEASLYENVDWMTFAHEQLYDMVNQGVDLAGATAVAAAWARLGEALQEIGDELTQALAASADAWQGEAADQARGTMAALSTWSTNTGATATEVSGCISVEADNAENARRSMPEPVPGIPLGTRVPVHPVHSGTSPMSAAFGSARDLVKDPAGRTTQQQAAHEEAARVMERFQDASQEVYGTVPAFSPPSLRQALNPVDPPAPPSRPEPGPVVPPVQGLIDEPAPAKGGSVAPPRESGPAVPRPESGPPAPGKQPAVAAPTPPVEQRPAAAAQPTSARPSAAAMAPGAMGAGAGHKEEDRERKSPGYLEGDPSLWSIADRLAPPVIGDDGA
ncbi:PPE domain-containing protein [Actinocrispum wychmicini]|uniref:PPE family protein n=1 Tax=Actinocrispum wychmicini TaxID=1213861 RepID=A0A4V6NP29_9PSEU|nr:PPE domain-containing protein [Actinocrispum wychmicini]TCO64420.1 PPE family protein [Actinocrispum wychmicini]